MTLGKRLFIAGALLIVLGYGGWVARHNQLAAATRRAAIEQLGTIVHLRVAGQSFTLPLVALPDFAGGGMSFSLDRKAAAANARTRRDSFIAQAADPATAPDLDRVEIAVRAFGWDDSAFDLFQQLCWQPQSDWAAAVCDDPWAPLIEALPRGRFYLANLSRPEAFDSISVSGGKGMGEQTRRMTLAPGRIETVCGAPDGERGRWNCTAALRLTGDLGAVWSVRDSADETAEQQAQREGAAIAAFVENGIGPREDYEALLRAVCALRRPGSSDRPNGSSPCAPVTGWL